MAADNIKDVDFASYMCWPHPTNNHVPGLTHIPPDIDYRMTADNIKEEDFASYLASDNDGSGSEDDARPGEEENVEDLRDRYK